MPFNLKLEAVDTKPAFPVSTATDSLASATSMKIEMVSATRQVSQENYVAEPAGSVNSALFSALAPTFRMRDSSELLGFMRQEPRVADQAPAALHVDNDMLNFRNGGADSVFEDVEHAHSSAFYTGSARPESVSSNLWGDDSATSSSTAARNDEAADTFDFLAKSLSSANSYVSMLTREQLAVLRAFRPSLLYEFLQEVAKVRNEKRLRRAGPNECAFCKNNGENEECYSTHALKDWRGRVLCPVLRGYRCPRCGATGDRAHTIKYCPEHATSPGLDRGSSFARRRAGSSSSLLFPPTPAPAPPTPAPSAHSSLWNFNLN